MGIDYSVIISDLARVKEFQTYDGLKQLMSAHLCLDELEAAGWMLGILRTAERDAGPPDTKVSGDLILEVADYLRSQGLPSSMRDIYVYVVQNEPGPECESALAWVDYIDNFTKTPSCVLMGGLVWYDAKDGFYSLLDASWHPRVSLDGAKTLLGSPWFQEHMVQYEVQPETENPPLEFSSRLSALESELLTAAESKGLEVGEEVHRKVSSLQAAIRKIANAP